MRKSKTRYSKLPLVLALAGLSGVVWAAENAAPTNEAEGPIVITGSARNTPKKKVQTSYSISTASAEQIKEAAPTSTADLLKIVPGVFVETTGGTAGANIAVRGFPTGGDAPYASMQLDGMALYPVSTLSFFEHSSLFRLDDTVERVEVLRGGPSPIWSTGQPGATVNFIQKKGKDVSEGSLRFTTGTGKQRRFDGYYGGKLSDGWYASVGGFYRESNGVRETGYPVDKGGQLSATLSHKYDTGNLNFSLRMTDDKNTFYTGIPLISRNNGESLSAYPGIDALTGAFQSKDLQNVQIETGPNGANIVRDLADGRGVKAQLFGADWNQDLGDWTLSNKLSWMNAELPTYALFTGDNPLSLGNYIKGRVADYGLAAGTTGTAKFVNGAAITDMTTPVIRVGVWSVDKKLKAVGDDLRLSRAFGNHDLTLGLYLSHYTTDDVWYLGNQRLMTAQSNAKPIDVVLSNGQKLTGNGFDPQWYYPLAEDFSGKNAAFTVADEWKISPQLRADAGIRYERVDLSGRTSNFTSGDIDANPNTLYNNKLVYRDGTYTPKSFKDSQLSWTAGTSYMVTPTLNLFGRLNSGVRFPNFDDLREGKQQVEEVDQFEVGVKSAGKAYHLYLTAFMNTFEGQLMSRFVNGVTNNVILSSRSYGLEFETAWRPMGGLELNLSGNYMQGKYRDSLDLSGKQVMRQPKLQARFSPSYKFSTDLGSLKLFGTYAHVGKRFGEPENQQVLGAYQTVDAGATLNVGDRYEVSLTGSNLTNELGLTEGNARVLGSGTSAGGVFMGRPLFGRSWQLSFLSKF